MVYLLEIEATKRVYRLFTTLSKELEAEYPEVRYGAGNTLRFSRDQARMMFNQPGDKIDLFNGERPVGKITVVQLR